jgi:Acyltransferase
MGLLQFAIMANSNAAPEDNTFDQLVDINLGDFYDALQIRRRPLLDLVMRYPARRFARDVLAFDARVGASGLRAAGAWACELLADGVEARNMAHVPATGPVLIVSNHPGLADTVALAACLPREDMRILANQRPFLQALTHTSARMVFVDSDATRRMAAFRGVVNTLKSGAAVLTFPAGKIEPDPDVRRDDALRSLDSWSDSIGLLARLVPAMQIVPVMVRGVYHPAVLRHPLARRLRDVTARERVASTLQIAWRGYQHNTLRIEAGPPLAAAALAQLGDPAAIMAAIRDAARRLT